MKTLLSILLISLSTSLFSQDIFGKWKTIDDETGKEKSIVEIYEKDGKAYGKIVKLFRSPTEEQDPSCTKCTDERAGKKINGMEIIRDMELDNDDDEEQEWEDGTILDPKTGKIYDCKMWVEKSNPNTLYLRGYIAFFFRTQTWVKQP